MALFAVVNEARFEARLDAGDDALINVGFTLFATERFDVDVDELLAVDDSHAGFLSMGRIE